MDIAQLKARLLKYLYTPTVGSIIAALFALGLGSTIWQTVRNIQLPKVRSVQPSFHQRSQINIQQLQNYHLMGTYASNLNDIPLASLGVTLQGIFSTNDGKSTALIALSGGTSKTYHVGDQLSANVSIEKILAKSVIIKHNGQLEKLEMPIKPITFSNNLPQSGLWK